MKFEHYQRNFLEKRINYRMKHLNLEYYQEYIEYIRSNPDEIDLFLDKFTINYTYFFRNLNIFESFEKFLKIYVKRLKRPLKIWSAPCATGDEPYSIAILLDHLKNLGNDFPDFEVVASDIDKTAIKIAKEGVYGDYAIHEVPITYLNKYFTKKNTEIGPKFIINQKVKEKVCFLQEDIIKSQNSNQKYDVIFCRNFIIYINQYAREKLIRVLKSRLHNGGLLILGGSETFSPHDSCFESISIRDRFYVKNFSSQRESFRREINNNFQNHKSKQLSDSTYKLKNQPNKMVLTKDEKKEKLDINKPISKSFSEKLKKISFRTHSPEKNLNKNQLKEVRPNLLKSEKRKPTEVRFTELVVNMRANGEISKDKGKTALIKNTKHSNQSEISPLDNNNLKLQVWEDDLKNRELLLDQREEIIEQRIINFERELGELEKRRKLAQILFKNAREKEKNVNRKTQNLEQLRKKLEKREQALEQKERQLQNRVNQLGLYSRKIIQREIQININSKEVEFKEEADITPFDEKRYDLVEKPNNKREFVIPMGYYSLINSYDEKINASKFTIPGLGSGIGLILKDPINNVFAMAHISLPNSSASKQGYHLLFPHTFVDTSVKDLLNNLIYNGAKKDNIKALIVSGAKLFLDYDMTYQENIDMVKKELESLNIEIDAEDTGGLSERSVVYDTINDALYVRKSWEFQYRLIS